jgi:hypothetical protein
MPAFEYAALSDIPGNNHPGPRNRLKGEQVWFNMNTGKGQEENKVDLL